MLCCGPDLHLSCSELVPRNTQKELGKEEVLGRKAGAAWPLGLIGLLLGTFLVPLGRKKGLLALRNEVPNLFPRGCAVQNRGPPGSRCFLQQLVA